MNPAKKAHTSKGAKCEHRHGCTAFTRREGGQRSKAGALKRQKKEWRSPGAYGKKSVREGLRGALGVEGVGAH